MKMEGENAFILTGGRPLHGAVSLSGAKNVALKVLVAALLCENSVTFRNIPDLKDIRELISLLQLIGVEVNFSKNTVILNAQGLNSHHVDLLYGSRIRTSFMLFAPFIHRFGKAEIPNPGGCRIGARPIDRQISLMEAFGVRTEYDSSTGYYTAVLTNGHLRGTEYTFSKKTHTGTELAIFFATVAEGQSVIRNVAMEPEIDSLIAFLNGCGAHIRREDESIYVDGSKHLIASSEPFSIELDRNEAVTYAVFAYATRGDIMVHGAQHKHLTTFLTRLDSTHAPYEVKEDGIRFFYSDILKATDIQTAPEPGFMTDWQAPWAVLMTQAQGISTIHETVFENRFGYVSELKKLSAHIEFYQPEVSNPEQLYQFDYVANIDDQPMQAIRIQGPTPLHGGVMSVTDMRAGATLLIAAAAAQGESVIIGVSEIDRGYEHIEVKLAALGADIKRI